MADRGFELRLSTGGYPIWVEIYLSGDPVGGLHHKELRRMAHQVDVAIRDARLALRARKPGLEDEV